VQDGIMLTLLSEQPLLLLALLLLLGALLGSVRIRGVEIGPAAVLFAAIGVSALGVANDVRLQVPELVGTLGLVLFTYTVGIIAGPSFFASLRRGWQVMLMVVVALASGGVLAVVAGKLLGLAMPVVAGIFAGSLTNTPALAAATERSGDTAGPTIGYSIAYLWGVVAMLIAAAWSLRHRGTETPVSEPIVHQTVRVEVHDEPTLAELAVRYAGTVNFSRLKHGHFASPTLVPDEGERLGFNDLITVVGPRDVVERVTRDLGHRSSHDIVEDPSDLDYRRVTISNRAIAGRTLAEIDLDERFGAHVSRIRRGDLDLVASPGFTVQMGDRVRVIAPASRMEKVTAHLGDSERGLSDINPTGFALGLGLGILVGLVHIPLPGGGFALGVAAGTLLSGLVFGRLGRVGPLVTSMSSGAAQTLSHFGMITFLAYAGTRAGQQITGAIRSDVGWKAAVVGLVVTSGVALLMLVLGRRVNHLGGTEHAGVIGGGATQPAVLAFANERTGFDTRVGLGYVLVYPAAMIAKILLAQALAGLS
jgi:putative transport protein